MWLTDLLGLPAAFGPDHFERVDCQGKCQLPLSLAMGVLGPPTHHFGVGQGAWAIFSSPTPIALSATMEQVNMPLPVTKKIPGFSYILECSAYFMTAPAACHTWLGISSFSALVPTRASAQGLNPTNSFSSSLFGASGLQFKTAVGVADKHVYLHCNDTACFVRLQAWAGWGWQR